MTDEAKTVQMVPRCEPPEGAVGNVIIESLRGRRGFASLIDSIDDEILAELKVTVGLKAIRAYLEVAPVTPPAIVSALVEALEAVLMLETRQEVINEPPAADDIRGAARAALAAYRGDGA